MSEIKPIQTKKSNLTKYIMMSLVVGLIFGWVYPKLCLLLPDPEKAFSAISETLSKGAFLFIQMIKMIIAPLVFSTLVVGIAGQGNAKSLGNIGSKTIVYFIFTTSLALLIGLSTANILQPGINCSIEATESQIEQFEQIQSNQKDVSASSFFTDIVPTSIFDAFAKNNIIQIVFFAVFFALALGSTGEKGKPILEFLKSLSKVMFKFTEYVMRFAPVGVFAAIASSIGENGIEILIYYGKLIFSLYLALAIFLTAVLMVCCMIVKVPFLYLLKAIKDPAVLAFSTASSEAALPKAMQSMEKFGVPKKIVGFVMPTGYSFNLDGSTLYLALAAIFIAQMFGIELSIWEQVLMMLTFMIASKGIAAVPRVSLIVLAGTLGSFNIPVIGIAVLLGIDHILDMGRTTVNLIGNCVANVVIARWENEFDYKKMHEYMQELDSPHNLKHVDIHPENLSSKHEDDLEVCAGARK